MFRGRVKEAGNSAWTETGLAQGGEDLAHDMAVLGIGSVAYYAKLRTNIKVEFNPSLGRKIMQSLEMPLLGTIRDGLRKQVQGLIMRVLRNFGSELRFPSLMSALASAGLRSRVEPDGTARASSISSGLRAYSPIQGRSHRLPSGAAKLLRPGQTTALRTLANRSTKGGAAHPLPRVQDPETAKIGLRSTRRSTKRCLRMLQSCASFLHFCMRHASKC